MCLFWLIMFSLINYWGCHYHSAAFAAMGLDFWVGTDWGFSCVHVRRLCTYSMCWQKEKKKNPHQSERFLLKERWHKNSLISSLIYLSTWHINVNFKCLLLTNITFDLMFRNDTYCMGQIGGSVGFSSFNVTLNH